MSGLTTAALLFVALGALVMLVAVWRTVQLLGMLDAETDLGRWKILAGMMAFFLVGYALVAGLLVAERTDLLVLMVGLVFFGGATFVLLVVGSGAHTISLLRQREERLRVTGAEAAQTAAQLGAVVENLADGLASVAPDGRLELANGAMVQLLEIDRDPVGATLDEILPPSLSELVRHCKGSAEAMTAEFELPGNRTGLAVATSIRTEGTDCGCVMLVRDITLAKEVDRMKSDFTAVVSHELRTPLTSVLGFAKLIRNKLERAVFPVLPEDDKKVQRAVEKVRSNLEIVLSEGQRLTALINDVLDISKMEAGQVEWNMRPLRARELCDRAIAATSSLFHEDRPVQLELEVEEGLGDVLGTEDRLIQVLINLISNASKFTDEGVITVRAARAQDAVEFSVRDTGIGIGPSDQEAVFQRFKQVGDPMTERPKGTGLGLPICKEIVTHHGGRIWLESKMGEGSRFAFTIPIVAETALPVDPRDLQHLLHQLKIRVTDLPRPTTNADVLVVDDDPALREMLTQQLSEAGYSVRTAADGVEAMQQARARRPDLVVLDVMMPGISGFDVVTMLRSDATVEDVPILILSIVEDAERGYRLGVDRYLNKPVDEQVLLGEIEALLHEAPQQRVLVVSDDASHGPVLSRMLADSGLELVGTCTREEASKRVAEARPDVVLVDAPGPAYEALERTLKSDPDLAAIHVVWLLDAARAAG